MNRKRFVTLALILLFSIPSLAQTGTKKKRPLPYEYGRVVLNNNATKYEMAPVVFEHLIHRSKFTCRVCHVDVGFGMKAGSTGIRAADIERGYYCGACHNGRTLSDGKPIFAACSTKKLTYEDQKRCDRCHSVGKRVPSDFDFFSFTAPLPKERYGNGVDWEKAEEQGLIHPQTALAGFTPKNPLVVQKDFDLNAKVEGMPDIIFSHKKHTVWNGCELCHPEIFMGVKKGNSHYTMVDISEGKSCGACHVTVAFPLMDCQRCHAKPVQP